MENTDKISENAERWLSVKQLSEIFPISKSELYLNVENESIPHKRWGRQGLGKNPKIMFKMSEIEAWLEKGCPVNKQGKRKSSENKSDHANINHWEKQGRRDE